MRILMSCGVKTQNIISVIEKQFTASGDEFIIVENLDDINGIFAKGEYFDKAIIAEQSITRDNSIRDEQTIRQRINDFAIECSHRHRKISYVFLTQYEEMATMIYDEILPILNVSVVVLKKPPYYANFFTAIIVSDVGQLPSEIVYVPENISVAGGFEQDTNSDGLLDDMDITPESDSIPLANEDPSSELFGALGGMETQETISDDIGLDKGEYMSEETEDLVPPQDTLYEEEATQDTSSYSYEATNTEFDTDDSSIYMEPELEYNRSGDLPDYTDNNMPQQSDPGFLQGFDTEDDEEEDEFGDDLYGSTQSIPNDTYTDDTQYQQQNTYNMPIASDQEDYDPLGQDLYNNEEPQQQEPDTYSQWDNPDMNNNQQGYDTYSQWDNDYNEAEHTQTNPGYRPQIGKKRKGLAGLLGGGGAQPEEMTLGNQSIGSKNIKKVKDMLKPFAARGNSIVVTGCGGCGTSTVAFHLANIISQLGYTVLLVDMDIEGRTQGYISKASYDSMDTDGSNLMSAVNSSTNMNSNAVVVKTGFHLLTMGLGTDIHPIEEQLHKEKIARFVSVVKTGYNFVIYDVPFRHATNFLSDITFMCDNLVIVTDASNWGITKTMLSVCNIDSDDMQDTVFHKAQLVFNRYRNLSKLFGLRVKTCDDIVQAMDRKVLDLVGDDIGLNFSRMSIAGIVNDDPMFENGWYEDVQYSDTKKGQDVFVELIESIVLKKH